MKKATDEQPKFGFWARLLDMIAPRACPICGHRLAIGEEGLCSCCILHLPRTSYWETPTDNYMARMLWGKVKVERAAALCFYKSHDSISLAIYDVKYKGKRFLGEVLGRLVATEMVGSGFFDGADMLVPVPLTKGRQRERGYNQSEELAIGISNVTGIEVRSDVLERVHFDGSQTTKDTFMRVENVENAFQLAHADGLAGKHVMLVDDVFTTGSTSLNCLKELLRGGAALVSVVTVAFVRSL